MDSFFHPGALFILSREVMKLGLKLLELDQKRVPPFADRKLQETYTCRLFLHTTLKK